MEENITYVTTEEIQREEIRDLNDKIHILNKEIMRQGDHVLILSLVSMTSIIVLIIKGIIPGILVLITFMLFIFYISIKLLYNERDDLSFYKKLTFVIKKRTKGFVVLIILLSLYSYYSISTKQYDFKVVDHGIEYKDDCNVTGCY